MTNKIMQSSSTVKVRLFADVNARERIAQENLKRDSTKPEYAGKTSQPVMFGCLMH